MVKEIKSSDMNFLERLLFSRVHVWILLLTVILLLVGSVGFGFVVYHTAKGKTQAGKVGELSLVIAQSPWKVYEAFSSLLNNLHHQEQKNAFSYGGFRRVDKTFSDDGYLLISGFSRERNQVTITLLELASQRTVHEWIPDVHAIFSMTPKSAGKSVNEPLSYRAQHPLLLPGGDLLVTSGEGPLVRIDACGKPVWAIDRHFHHSIELDSEGMIVVPIVTERDEIIDGVPVRDDGIAIVSQHGEIIEEYSLSEILLSNGYDGVIFGVGNFEKDRFHLNDAQPFRGRPARDGILLSLRHLSTVLLFRPDTNRVDWLQTGPWLNQHDIDELGGGRFSVFGNDVIRGPGVLRQGHSELYIFEPDSGEVTRPYSEVLKKAEFQTKTQGRSEILGNGDLFVEETDRNRLLRLSERQLRWAYVHQTAEGVTGALHWSRYLTRAEVQQVKLDGVSCDYADH